MIEDMPDDDDLPKHRPKAEEGNKQEREETERKLRRRGERRE
jgi:hypothetical protein